MPLQFEGKAIPEDLEKELYEIESNDENGLLTNASILLERLQQINTSFSQRDAGFMLFNGIDAFARSNTDVTGSAIQRAIYRTHNIPSISRVWDKVDNKEQLAAINTSIGEPVWLVFRINQLVEAAQKAGQKIKVIDGEIVLPPHIVIRISNDIDLAVLYPSIFCDGEYQREKVGRVLSSIKNKPRNE